VQSSASGDTRVLEHLLDIEYEPEVLNAPEDAFVSIKKIDAAGLLESQIQTTDWLKTLGAATDDEVITQAEQTQATEAFATAITGSPDAKAALTKITTPPAIARIVSMMTAYEWQFVEEAQRLRAMAVAKIVEETDHPDARIRLKALELLGKVTEVGLFTERIEVKKTALSDLELDAKIKEKLLQIQNTIEEPVNDEDILDVDLTEEEDGESSE
jgi:hypothetical protein